MNGDGLRDLASVAAMSSERVVAFIAPPWGQALSERAGLDLRRTMPPVAGIIDVLFGRFRRNRVLCGVQIHESVDAQSLDELKPRFEWWTTRVYGLDAAGQRHGIFLGSRNPPPARPK